MNFFHVDKKFQSINLRVNTFEYFVQIIIFEI